jgi:DNA gyrase inhibitor GyrI
VSRRRQPIVVAFGWSFVVPVTYSIDTGERLIRTTCSGPVKLAEIQNHFRTLMEDPAATGRLDVLLNVSEARVLPQSSQLVSVSAELAAIRDKVRFGICAIVAESDAMFGMMRMFEVFAGKYFRAIQVFRGTAEAEAWLAAQRAARDSGRKPNPQDM